MKGNFVTARGDTIAIYPSSNIYNRVWLSIQDTIEEDKRSATELGIYDCKILISMLEKALKSLQERTEEA